jgi:hypothetical protein
VILFRRPFLAPVISGLIAISMLSACGGESGPSFASAIDTASTRLYAEDAKALMFGTLVSVYGYQDVSTPLPVSAVGSRAPVDPFAIARRFLDRAARLGDVRPAEGSPLATFLARPEGGPALANHTCIPTVTGVDSLGYAIDTDADGVPDDLKVDFRTARSESLSGLVYTYSGSFRIHDDEVGWGRYSFIADHLTTKLVNGSNGDNIKDVVTGTEHADFAADLATHDFDVNYARIGTFGGDQLSVTFDLVESSSYDPDPGSSFTIGGGRPIGSLTLTLDYQAVGKGISGDDVHFSFSTPTPLHYMTGCASTINSGVLRGLLNGDTDTGFRLTWSNCNGPALVMFGTTDGP